VGPLKEMTRLTPSSSPTNGFPPLVSKALLRSLARKESACGVVKSSPSGWAQRDVLEGALELLQSSLSGQDTFGSESSDDEDEDPDSLDSGSDSSLSPAPSNSSTSSTNSNMNFFISKRQYKQSRHR